MIQEYLGQKISSSKSLRKAEQDLLEKKYKENKNKINSIFKTYVWYSKDLKKGDLFT
jgi:hypothetical protein